MEQTNQVDYSLDLIPEELLIKIVGYCKEDERKALSLVNKKFYRIHRRHIGANFVFHLQGHTMKLFNQGMTFLFRLQTVPFKILKISSFNLKNAFGQWDLHENSILGKPIQHYLDNSDACRKVISIEIINCLVTDESLLWLRRLFPCFVLLTMFRCCFTRASNKLARLEDVKIPSCALKTLKLSFPLITDCNPSATGWNESKGDFATWLIDYCNYVEKIVIFKSKVSINRATKRSFYQMSHGNGWKVKAREELYDYTITDFEGQIHAMKGRYGSLKHIKKATMPVEQ